MNHLFEYLSQNLHATLNTLVWALSLVLQCILFALLFSRGIARRFPFFASLIGLYILRSAVLFLIFNHVSPSNYTGLRNLLLLLEIIVQICVAVELTLPLARQRGGWSVRQGLLLLGLLWTAGLCTFLATAILPPHAPLRADRSQLFFSFFMIFLCAWAYRPRAFGSLARRIISGVALYGIVNIAANIGRINAAADKLPRVYAAWSYALVAIYLIVVVLWLATLRMPPDRSLSAPL
ncbi:hypothetical protein EDE15_2433 [Edaphobacter aggregans]|uniref:Uncharacterized protein n=1 Tax=Edaphobacter aggregans TaxID=570835 RepID=A0A3R9WGU8_9BACT|nr:hypothetical protein [Edaphobacter aggregans]RSL16906.1 hypothetical protein EDE15_2433 [Edaphobacter aggregans]